MNLYIKLLYKAYLRFPCLRKDIKINEPLKTLYTNYKNKKETLVFSFSGKELNQFMEANGIKIV